MKNFWTTPFAIAYYTLDATSELPQSFQELSNDASLSFRKFFTRRILPIQNVVADAAKKILIRNFWTTQFALLVLFPITGLANFISETWLTTPEGDLNILVKIYITIVVVGFALTNPK
jgi:hypothetical protein